jgi:hypothetical protein
MTKFSSLKAGDLLYGKEIFGGMHSTSLAPEEFVLILSNDVNDVGCYIFCLVLDSGKFSFKNIRFSNKSIVEVLGWDEVWLKQ